MKALSNQQRIVEFLQQHQQAAIGEIADALALTGKQTSAAMQRLVKRGQVERVPGQRKIRYQLVAGHDERLRQPHSERSTITGRDAVWWYLERFSRMTVSDCARAVGVTENAVSQAVSKMVREGSLVLDERAWRVNYYRLPDSGRPGVNTVFDECRQNWGGYRIHKIIGGRAQA
ncbi:hypothetical protein TUM12370_17730 [Salmonella enterica subsp. enterica serovar Choleraesuis]|nr:hypothetical protein TUM12370_17730 [Salmonella enterica subsp. enterica serovar Choleraesuis]